MSETVKIPRITEDVDQTVKGEPGWIPVVDGERRPAKPVIRCNCGQRFGLRNHHVHVDGRVTASFFDRDGCGWHVFLELEGYDQGDFPPEK